MGADQAGIAHPSPDGQRQHQVQQAGPQESNERNRQKNAGKGKKRIHDKDIEQRVHPAAIEAGQAAQHQAQAQRKANHAHRHHEREPRAFEDTGEDIPAELIRAEPVSM